jgi:hypothetical protein
MEGEPRSVGDIPPERQTEQNPQGSDPDADPALEEESSPGPPGERGDEPGDVGMQPRPPLEPGL